MTPETVQEPLVPFQVAIAPASGIISEQSSALCSEGPCGNLPSARSSTRRVYAVVGVTRRMAKIMSIGGGAVGLLALTFVLSVAPSVSVQDDSSHFQEVRRFATEEATQGVAVDENFFYAISNRRIGKYDKHTGQRVGGWEGEPTGPIIHLDSGIVRDGLLSCAHSNYPGVPMVSSVEVFDTETLEHVGSHSFGIRWLCHLD